MIALTTPILLICLLVTSIILLFIRKWLLAMVIISIAVVINVQMEYMPVHMITPYSEDNDLITIATHNIYSQGEYLDKNRESPDSLYKIIRSLEADIILIQEYDSGRCSRLTEWLQRDGYYIYQKKHSNAYGENAIFSRMQLTDIGFGNAGLNMFATLNYNGHIVNIINCHLCSNNIGEKIINNDGNAEWLNRFPEYLRSIIASGNRRKEEANELRLYIDSSLSNNNAVVVAGDMNDVSGSCTLRIIEGKGQESLNDAWWYSGSGIGNTYHGHDWLHFRLDHILYSCHFESSMTQVIKQPYSDHEILVTKLKIRNDL